MDWRTRIILGLVLVTPVACLVAAGIFLVLGNIPAVVGFVLATVTSGLYAVAACA
jgi:phosphotransferase system  glucose/maltose/N-acetylglucosamine-specific IIC component